MAGRFSLYTDADIQGAVVKALSKAGWDVVRAIDEFPEGTDDPIHFARAAELGRALVTLVRWCQDNLESLETVNLGDSTPGRLAIDRGR